MSDTTTHKINVSLLPAYVTATVAARLGIPAPGSVVDGRTPDCKTENHNGTCVCVGHGAPDYSDGYGGTYAVGE